MSEPSSARGPWWVGSAVLAGSIVVVLGVVGLLLAGRGARLGLPAEVVASKALFGLLTVESVAFALIVPFLVVRSLGFGRWWERAASVVVPLLAIGAASIVLSWGVSRGPTGVAEAAWAQVYLLSFAAFLAAAVACVKRLGCRPTTAQLVATGLALAMVANVFYVNAIIYALRGPGAKMAAARLTLWTNPWLIVGGTILLADPLRCQQLYDWYVMADYPLPYPAAGLATTAARALLTSAAYLGAALLLAAFAWLLPRRARPRTRAAAPPNAELTDDVELPAEI